MNPVPVVSWSVPRTDWLEARKGGVGGSDVPAILGLSRWSTPWQVWANKTGKYTDDRPAGRAADLGNRLEPWLIHQATELLGVEVMHTVDRMYHHPIFQHHMCSPDAISADYETLVECKTAGLTGSGAIPVGWTTETIPEAYEIQCRWQMHVMGMDRTVVVALVAGLGLRTYTIERDLVIEAELVTAIDQWWQRHVVDGVEPEYSAADNEVLGSMYPSADDETSVELGVDGAKLVDSYKELLQIESRVKLEKDEIAVKLKGMLGEARHGIIDGVPTVRWSNSKGSVDYKAVVASLETPPDIEGFRRPGTRVFGVK